MASTIAAATPCVARLGQRVQRSTAAPRSLTPLAPRRTARVPAKFVVRAEQKQSTEVDVDAMVKDLQAKWDAVENKTTVAVYGAGAIVFLWFSSTIVSAVNSVPLLPKFLELVGLGYSAWFTYRYLLFKSSREELLTDIEELKSKIAGKQ